MPDTRRHRGAHPEDHRRFGPGMRPPVAAAVADLSLLLSRGYSEVAALKLVGDRYGLEARQRHAIARIACSDTALERQLGRRRPFPPGGSGGANDAARCVRVDGYNVDHRRGDAFGRCHPALNH